MAYPVQFEAARGRYHAFRRNWPLTAAGYGRAIARSEGTPHWNYRLGIALANIGDWEGAFDSYQNALRLDPDLQKLTWREIGTIAHFAKHVVHKKGLGERQASAVSLYQKLTKVVIRRMLDLGDCESIEIQPGMRGGGNYCCAVLRGGGAPRFVKVVNPNDGEWTFWRNVRAGHITVADSAGYLHPPIEMRKRHRLCLLSYPFVDQSSRYRPEAEGLLKGIARFNAENILSAPRRMLLDLPRIDAVWIIPGAGRQVPRPIRELDVESRREALDKIVFLHASHAHVSAWLARLPQAVSHGDLRFQNALSADTGGLIMDWGACGTAPLGCDARHFVARALKDGAPLPDDLVAAYVGEIAPLVARVTPEDIATSAWLHACGIALDWPSRHKPVAADVYLLALDRAVRLVEKTGGPAFTR